MDTNLLRMIEAQRVELEANIARLRKVLHHWTALELDYEGLKDEFQTLRDGASAADCFKVAYEFAPQKVDEKELKDLIEPSPGRTRSPIQVVELLSKRVEYVLRNTESLKKQISDLETKRNAVLLAARADHEAEAALPLTEITEQLDDEGNVLSSNVIQQGDTAKKVLDVLKKTKVQPADSPSTQTDSSRLSSDRIVELSDSEEEQGSQQTGDREANSNVGSTGVASELYPQNPDDNEEEAEMRQEMINYGLDEVGNIVAELELADAQDGRLEDEEDMLNDADMSEDEDQDEDVYDDSEDSMDDDSEDENGRSRTSVHTDKYHNQMEELQKQLGLQMENVGPSPQMMSGHDASGQISYIRDSDFNEQMNHLSPEFRKRFGRLSPAQAARQAAIAREEASRNDKKVKDNHDNPSSTKRKKVAFAPTVDVAPSTSTTKSGVMKDTMIERSTTRSHPPEPVSSAKISRFKAARASRPQEPSDIPSTSTPPRKINDDRSLAARPILQDLVERPGISSVENAPPPDADHFDEELQRRQIALEHHKLRNKLIHEQGGYVRGGEAENWGDAYAAPNIEDEQTGEPVKISRFKAARLRP